jgi:cyclophilin family peptidyl-prolyl cis-trans isomerase
MRIYSLIAVAAVAVLCSCGEKSPPPPPPPPAAAAASAAPATPAAPTTPDSFRVAFETTRGRFVIQVNTAWAPKGAERFRELTQAGFFNKEKFFRTIPDFVTQFGLSANPSDNKTWDKPILDDPVHGTNARGTFVFATQGPNTRTHQFFINLKDNANLDAMGFAPLGRIVEGMAVVDSLYGGYGEDPNQTLIQMQGNTYLDRTFPKLDEIKSAKIISP